MQNIQITTVQTAIFWKNKTKNLEYLSGILANLTAKQDLIVLTEMFNTGFTMQPENYAEEMNGPTIKWLKQMAEKTKSTIVGSLMVNDEQKSVNRLVWVSPEREIIYYDKRHLFRLGNEQCYFRHGEKPVCVDLKGWKIKPLICYDLRFPVWSKNRFANDKYEYDLLLYVANWPASRSNVWNTLLAARAIENQCYVVGVNRIGTDGTGVDYVGDSSVISPKGNILYHAANTEEINTINLHYTPLQRFREMFTVGKDWDDFTIHY